MPWDQCSSRVPITLDVSRVEYLHIAEKQRLLRLHKLLDSHITLYAAHSSDGRGKKKTITIMYNEMVYDFY